MLGLNTDPKKHGGLRTVDIDCRTGYHLVDHCVQCAENGIEGLGQLERDGVHIDITDNTPVGLPYSQATAVKQTVRLWVHPSGRIRTPRGTQYRFVYNYPGRDGLDKGRFELVD